jgi:hypothetical protein
MSWVGLLALIQSIVNPATIGPIVLMVGLMINQECLDFMPSRHYAAYIVGLFPCIYDWVANVSARSPLTDDGTYNTNTPGGPGWIGVLAWKRGSLLVSLLWVAILVQVIDRQWKLATIWSLIAAAFSLFGIIHVPEAGFENFATPFWEQCTGPDPVVCWEFAEQWMFFVAYLVLATTFVLIGIAAKTDKTIEEPVDDETRHAFDDWFKDAKVVSVVGRNSKSFFVAERAAMEEKLEEESIEMKEKEEETAAEDAQFESFMDLMNEPTTKEVAAKEEA